MGAGGFGREVLDIIEAVAENSHDIEFAGFFDDDTHERAEILARGSLVQCIDALVTGNLEIVLAVGNSQARCTLAKRLVDQKFKDLLAHPETSVGSKVEIGIGGILAAGSRITTNVTTGAHFQLHQNSTIGHDSVIGSFVTVLPGANISGNVTIGDRSTIGAGSVILPGVRIGSECFVGAGAVVTKDVADGQVVVGIPAKPITGE